MEKPTTTTTRRKPRSSARCSLAKEGEKRRCRRRRRALFAALLASCFSRSFAFFSSSSARTRRRERGALPTEKEGKRPLRRFCCCFVSSSSSSSFSSLFTSGRDRSFHSFSSFSLFFFSHSLTTSSNSPHRLTLHLTDKAKNAASPRNELSPAPAPGAMEADAAAADADASLSYLIESKSSVFDPGSGRFSLKGVSPIVSAVTLGGPAGERGLARLVAADFYPSLKGAADVVVAGDRNGTADRYFLRLSDASYDRQTASVDFKAEMRSARDPPLLKNGAVAATQTGTDKDKILKVLTPTGRPISLNNVMVVADARAPKGVGKGVLPAGATGAAGECAGWGCALKA